MDIFFKAFTFEKVKEYQKMVYSLRFLQKTNSESFRNVNALIFVLI